MIHGTGIFTYIYHKIHVQEASKFFYNIASTIFGANFLYVFKIVVVRIFTYTYI